MNRISILFVAMTAVASAAFAVQPIDRACMNQARQDVLACREQCTDNFRTSKFLCHDVDPACGRQCVGARESCIELAVQPLEECLGSCRDTLQTAKGACTDSCGEDSACRDTCIDQAQATAFTCRDDCTDSFRTNGGEADVDQCRADFKICVDSCPHGTPR